MNMRHYALEPRDDRQTSSSRRNLLKATLAGTGSALISATSLDAIARPLTRGNQDIFELTAVELSAAIRAKKVSCHKVIQAYLAQIDRLNPKVNAIVAEQNPKLPLRQADERDYQISSGRIMGWMHGFPQAPKDLANAAGIVTTTGSLIPKSNALKADAIIVERARRNGAIYI